MLLNPSLVNHKQKLGTTFNLAQLFFILCAFISTNKAGVIKKRNTAITTPESGITNLTDVKPTILTALHNSSVTTKLQFANRTDFSETVTSKELGNNEVLLNEARKLLEQEDKIINFNTKTVLKGQNEKTANQSETAGNNNPLNTKPEDNPQEIILNRENKEDDKITVRSSETNSNEIKADKIQKKGSSQAVGSDKEILNSLENNIKINNEDSSRILSKLEMETESTNFKPNAQETQLENSMETTVKINREYQENILKSESNEKTSGDVKIMLLQDVTPKPTETITLTSLSSSVSAENSKENDLKLSSFEAKNHQADDVSSKVLKTNKTDTNQESTTLVSQTTENMEALEMTTINPTNPTENKLLEVLTKPQATYNENGNKTVIRDGLDREELVKSNEIKHAILTTTESAQEAKIGTTFQSFTAFEDDNAERIRSMFVGGETKDFEDLNEVLMPVTTFRPATLSKKQAVDENVQHLQKEFQLKNVSSANIKEKKAKFINDNSTNAQQLNLPNNAEVWSLAAMKSPPKANVTLETTPAYNQTSKPYMENLLHNVTLAISSNSEKNLLDWSQIVMDKELSATTIRNEDSKNQQNLEEIQSENQLTNEAEKDLDTLVEGTTTLSPKQEPKEDVDTKNLLIEPKLSINTISSTNMTTILSHANNNDDDENNNKNNTDKKFKENMNKRVETLTKTVEAATTTATNVDNNPFNITLNIEPDLNKINLTSNQNENHLNNELHNKITTDGKPSADDNVNANAETSMTTTEATAVVYMTTVEQISSETTTVSTPETSKQNTSSNKTLVITEEQQNKNSNKNINVNLEESNSLAATSKVLENTVQQENQYENIELNTKTTTFVPITTFRPNILAITSTTSIPATFEQEIDQNGNENQTNSIITSAEQQQQSIITHDNNLKKAIETHLSEREFETTTIAIITNTTTISPDLINRNIENTLTLSLENNTDTTTTTSSSKDELINETTERSLESRETTTQAATPKQVDENTTGSPVLTEGKLKGKETETTTETIWSTVANNETPKTPVVFVAQSTVPPIITTTEQSIIEEATTSKQEHVSEEDFASKNNDKPETTTITTTIRTTMTTTTSVVGLATTHKDEETYISLLDDKTATTTTTQAYSPTILTTSTPPPTTTTITAASSQSPSTSTLPAAITTKVEEIYNVIHSTTTELIQTTTQQLLTEVEEEDTDPNYPSSTFATIDNSSAEMLPPAASTTSSPKTLGTADIGKSLPTLTSIMGGNSGNIYAKNPEASGEADVNVIIAITVSVIGVIALILLVGFLYLMRKRQKQNSYPNRCRPVSMDEFTIDNASISGSMRKSSALRSSKRTYGNLAFDDPSLRHNAMGVHELGKFAQEKLRIFEEFRDVPQITSRLDEVPPGCEDKNRYANVLPLPETRVILQRLNDDEKTEYINANYVTGPKDPPNYYIACQAPLDTTVEDFWRMIWEQQSRVIIQATDLIENGVEKCAEYLPPSVTLDNHSSYGDFQITLQNREVKDKYAISTILLKNVVENASRELTHYWYKWPEVGVPSEEAPIIAMLLEVRSSLISYAIEQANEEKEKPAMATLKSAEEGTVPNIGSTTTPITNSNVNGNNGSGGEINGNISMVHIKKTARNQGPLTVHCSPGTGRTGTIIACDIAIRSLETPKRTVDIPQIVYYVRRGRASAVLTKEQYEFIYKVANMYAAKITNPTNYN